MKQCDYLILGTGIAGLTAALKAGEKHRVVLLTKGKPPEGATNYAQGGIASVMSPADKIKLHIQDTLDAGDGLCREDRVKILATEGPNTIRALVDWGVRFTKNKSSGKVEANFHLALEGGHSHERILHAKDFTGREITRALYQAALANPKIEFCENHAAFKLLTQKKRNGKVRCTGVAALDRKKGEVVYFSAKVTILATGGAGQLYRHTTNPGVSTGDGIAMAYAAGAAIEDMEFFQFHPTALFVQGLQRPFLISEALRGFGARLVNRDGETFMDGIHVRGALAPRDVVARAIDFQMKNRNEACMYLDITHRSCAELQDHFPSIFQRLLESGINMSKDRIPVVPAAHYMCGGVRVDSWARTGIDNLYACGETSCTGVHGANRLASNSLLESVVFSLRAWEHSRRNLPAIPKISIPQKTYPHFNGRSSTATRWKKQLRDTMWDNVGIVRSKAGLESALKNIRSIARKVEKKLSTEKVLAESFLELHNMCIAAELLIRAALQRKESRGLHYSVDYPTHRESFRKHFCIRID